MKKRTARPLLRASALLAASTATACTLSEGSATPLPEPIEFADTRWVSIGVRLPDDAVPKGPIQVSLYQPGTEGPPIATRSFPIEATTTTVRWEVDPAVSLPKTLRVKIVIEADDDPVTPSARDLVADVTDTVGSLFVALMQPRIPLHRVVLGSVLVTQPVYANTKGSHHMQDPPAPVEVLRLHVSAGFAQGGVLSIEVAEAPEEPPVLNAIQFVTSYPAEIVLMLPPGHAFPEQARVSLSVGRREGTYGATAQVERGGTVAVDLKP